MPLPKLWKSTPFRISILNALVAALLIILTAIVLLNNFYRLSRARLETLLTEEFSVLEEQYANAGVEAAARELDKYIRNYPGENRIFALFDRSGVLVAGNVKAAPAFSGFAELQSSRFDLSARHKIIAFSGPLGEHRLVIGFEMLLLDQIAYSLYSTLLWASFAIGVVSIVMGGLIGANASRRLSDISSTIDRFSKGDLNAQIDRSGSGDDIDQISEQINSKLLRIREMMTTIKEISSDISHDLKTPLSRLYLSLQEASLDVQDQPALQMKLAEACEQTESTIAIFDAMLNLTRIENAVGPSGFQSVELNKLIKELSETFEVMASERNIVLNHDTNGGGAKVSGDRKLLTQMIVNLIENAIRHTPTGTIIHLGAAEIDDKVVLTIMDNGPGIPKNEREKVFQRLYRLERSRTTQGTGLGFPLIQAIAKNHGGAVTIDDANPGLIVRIVFPRLT